jgi:hypothetical protein
LQNAKIHDKLLLFQLFYKVKMKNL